MTKLSSGALFSNETIEFSRDAIVARADEKDLEELRLKHKRYTTAMSRETKACLRPTDTAYRQNINLCLGPSGDEWCSFSCKGEGTWSIVGWVGKPSTIPGLASNRIG